MAKPNYRDLLTAPAAGSLFGQLALRDLLLPDLLGEETPNISYWAGRALARQLPVAEDDLSTLFVVIGFGELAPDKATHTERRYKLSGNEVETRLTHFPEADFRLEAGFLAQSLQQVLGVVCEAHPVIDARKKIVTITAALDPTTPQPYADELISLSGE